MKSFIIHSQTWEFDTARGMLEHPNGYNTSWFARRDGKWQVREWGCDLSPTLEREILSALNYFPSAIRGVTYPGHIRVNRSQLRRYMELGNPFDGFLVGSNVNSSHFFKLTNLAVTVACDKWEDFETSLNSFEFYLEPELGKRAAIYLKKP